MDKINIKSHEKKLQLKHSVLGIISIVLGVLGILTSCLVLYFLKQVIGPGFKDNIANLVRALNFFSNVELIVVYLGLITSIVGLFQNNRQKMIVKIGLIINLISVAFMAWIIYGAEL